MRPRIAVALALGAALVAPVMLTGCTAVDSTGPATPAAAPAHSGTAAPTASAVPAIPQGAFDEVLALIVERLATGDAVAASKYFSGQPVTDEAREKAVLDAAAARATEVAADQAYISLVFTDQITASKEIQQSLLDSWAAATASPPSTAPDLATEVRPILDRITQELVPALGEVEQYRGDPGCVAAVAEAAAAAAPEATSASPTALAARPTATAHLCD